MKINKLKNAIVFTLTKEVNGVFFRNPFFKEEQDCSGFTNGKCVNLDRLGLVHKLLNSRKRVNYLKELIQTHDNLASFYLWSLRSPLYFKRQERLAKYISKDVVIEAYGYNFMDEQIGGGCETEITTVYINGKLVDKYKSSVNQGYYNTYEHKLLEIVSVKPTCN